MKSRGKTSKFIRCFGEMGVKYKSSIKLIKMDNMEYLELIARSV
jgi:hypothetical protein